MAARRTTRKTRAKVKLTAAEIRKLKALHKLLSGANERGAGWYVALFYPRGTPIAHRMGVGPTNRPAKAYSGPHTTKKAAMAAAKREKRVGFSTKVVYRSSLPFS